MKIANLKISTRLALGFGAMAMMMAALGVFTIWKADFIGSSVTDITRRRMDTLKKLGDMRDAVNSQAIATHNLVFLNKPEDVKTETEQFFSASKKVEEILAYFFKISRSSKGRELLSNINTLRENYVALMNQVFAARDGGRTQDAVALLTNDIRRVHSQYFSAIQDLSELQTKEALKAGEATIDSVELMKVMVWIIGAVTLLLSTLLSFWIIRSVTSPINTAIDVARGVARGELTAPIVVAGNNEPAALMSALRAMQIGLVEVVTKVRLCSNVIGGTSVGIASGTQNLSDRTVSQAGALEETAASMEELSETVKQNAENARQANQLAQTASTVAEQGGAVVAQVVETMRNINESSKQIAEIIGVIDSIAFQTNILALNAAVESARAGEQGRGFAVVAAEVRNLASRSASAAREIAALISESVSRVEQGSVLADQAGITMSKVVSSIHHVTELMGEISTANDEQARSVAHIGEAISQMDQVTQQNAALVDEMADTARGLKSQSQELVDAVATFKIE